MYYRGFGESDGYIGATLCTAVPGVVFRGSAISDGLRMLALVLTLVAALLLPSSLRRVPSTPTGVISR